MDCYVIGVDAGGSKTQAIAYSPDGSELARASRGGGNPLADRHAAMNNVAEAICACAQQGMVCLGILVGMAGSTGGEDIKEKLSTQVQAAIRAKGLWAPLRLISDATLALEAHFGDGEGILLIAGTGSIAYGRRGGQIYRADGWGYLLGDEGSGFDIARTAVRHTLLLWEGGLEEDALSLAVRRELGADSPGDCVARFYARSPRENASLAQQVDRLALQGDEGAMAILRRAGDSLSSKVRRLHERSGFPNPFPLALHGSVILGSSHVRQAMLEGLAAHGLRPDILPPTEPQRAALHAFIGK